ncbi:UNVERIFIED_CONTAM: protein DETOXIFICATION 34 [Sesamum calycinum]|uniref:Protein DETOXIFICATION 34 n=1 Tax=Sesamum calycinum TaxID=2727403 RepID=A0AAW2IQS1_9LAMI
MVVLEMEKSSSDTKSSSNNEAILHEAPSVLLLDGDAGDYPPMQSFQDAQTLLRIESVKLWAIAAPIAFNILCNYGINSFTSIFVGHIGDVELSAVAISLSVIANLSFGFLLGMASALETLCGQAFGAGEIKMLGVVFKWGLAGAAAAYDISAWGIALAQMVYIVGWCQDSWTGLSWLAFREIWAFFRLSIASAIMLCLEIWYFMSIIVLTGHLDNPVLAVGSLSICMNLNGWEGMIFIGVNAAISVRVSNELGSGHPRAAKCSVFVAVFESLIIGLLSMVATMATKDHFAALFTSSEQMQKAVSNLAYLLAITMVLNSVQPVISGVAVGGGWQGLVAYINLTCYYIIGLPVGFFLGYKTRLGVQGIWIGMIFGTFLQTVILLIIVWKTNWNKEVAEASERMRRWGGQSVD